MQAMISIKDGRIERSGQSILTNVHLSLEKGEFRYLTGKSGSGKTSLLKSLYGAGAIQADEAIVAGVNLLNLDYTELPAFRRRIGMVFQDFRLFMDKTVRANLYVVMKATGWEDEDEIKARIMAVLESVGLEEKSKMMPGQLSGGEQQRLSIARALLNRPGLIIADEPTGNLDPTTSDQILQLLRRLTRDNGVAVLCATHDHRLIEKYRSPVALCEGGTLKVMT